MRRAKPLKHNELSSRADENFFDGLLVGCWRGFGMIIDPLLSNLVLLGTATWTVSHCGRRPHVLEVALSQ
jgi:hypothetical protein